MDKYSGQAGTFQVNKATGERELEPGSQGKPHPEGDAPRNERGERLDRGETHQAQAAPQPALPEPADQALAQEQPAPRKRRSENS